ncbi:hypothetical protein [Novosphingobium beihaiensis]|uniref:Helix-turn-helix domain-containing protein n=1 Tax=Novosphingobium beihaiensis TaxID=2930389 RepID=A0ABT0BNG2_9SPHN|nr:hypothetical protein [Novosphingobium beihaiensis]MCJ2186592.1 hypothetical protein [Novosphingobium beihaiensis]
MPQTPLRWPAYLRIPPFVPVPLRHRRDGWSAVRQGEFVGWLAETGSVSEAAARVGASRESVYQLRRREGAVYFAAAWDFALAAGAAGQGDIPAFPKLTGWALSEAAHREVVAVRMRCGRYAGCSLKPSTSALLRVLAQFDRGAPDPRAPGWW